MTWDAAGWEERVRRDHWCACATCDPSLRVTGERQGLQHVGVRFWGEEEARRGAIILLDGLEIGNVFEAILGEQGTIWVYQSVPWTDERGDHPRGYHPCLNCRDAAEKAGLLSPDGFLIRKLADGTEEQINFEICSLKRTGRVEIYRPAVPADAK